MCKCVDTNTANKMYFYIYTHIFCIYLMLDLSCIKNKNLLRNIKIYRFFLLLPQQVHIKLYVWYVNIKIYREPKGNVFVYSKFAHTEKALVGFPL